jgi:ligand-binding sensor domain-containing protein/signal transduction histidine kinase
MRMFLVWAAVAVSAVAAHEAFALDGHRGMTQYAQTRYEAHDGIAHNLVNSIVQTPDGYLWGGSEEGLTRYDGTTFRIFDRRNTPAIPTNTITALAVDSAGVLWVGTRDHGILRLVDGEFQRVTWEPGAQDAQIRSLELSRDGELWIGLHDHGLVRLRDGVLVAKLASSDGLPSDDVRSVLAARDGTLWFGTFRGIAQWNAGRVVRGPSALNGIAIDDIAQAVNGDLWCATANGLAHVHGNDVEWVGDGRLQTQRVRQVMFDRDGNLWIGTGAGVARMTPDGRIDALAHPTATVLALYEDAEGDVWIGTEGGLDRLRDGDIIPFGAAQGAADDIIFTIREDAAGAMWIAGNAGLFRVPPGRGTATKIADGHGTMYGIFQDSRGDIWFGARDGSVGRWHDNQFTWIGQRSWERVRAFAETAAGMWVGTDNGLFRLHGDRLEDAETVMAGIAVSAITPDASGALWLATESGVMCWRAGSFRTLPSGGPPSNTSATTIQFDHDGAMWVTTEGAGLWRLRNDHWFGFTTRDGMFDDLVWRLLEDDRGTFWLSSNRGIWTVTRRQLEERAEGTRKTVDFVLYGEGDGMPDRECDGSMEPAGWRARDGRMWFPTVKGVAIVDAAHLHPMPPSPALIDSVRIDGEPQRLGPALELAPGSNRLEIVYTAPALKQPERLRFRYRLDGFDTAWNDAGAQRIAQYTNLAPGSYRFVVEAGRGGAWGHAASIAVTLRPQIYQTRGFYALVIAMIVLASVAVPLLRIRQLRARARELAERIREAVSELAEREQRLRDTQAQLVNASRQAGRSDVATAVLHNVGNVLNSVNVSVSLINENVGNLKTTNLSKIADLINQHRDDLGRFFRDDHRGQKLPEYFAQLGDVLERDKASALSELKSLIQNLEHIKTIVRSQQSYVTSVVPLETLEVRQLLDEANKLSAGSSEQDSIEIVSQLDELPPVRIDRHKALQILVNLLANARAAVMSKTSGPRRIVVRARRGTAGNLEITIEDNGCGVAPENLDKIFQLGFTTKGDGLGHGLGLHYSACAALELNGKIAAHSAGLGSGASFVLVLPFEPAADAAIAA